MQGAHGGNCRFVVQMQRKGDDHGFDVWIIENRFVVVGVLGDVLLGFVRNVEHRGWIERTRQYNIRAGDRAGAVEIGGRELGAKLLLLYENRNGSLHVAGAAEVTRWRPATVSSQHESGEWSGRLTLALHHYLGGVARTGTP